ncbi:hypothetical protein T06_13281 [Trichinella sp. T6]|nr:hypothetical protein T06_13281 [Trichinella sp. T6]
MRLVFISQTTLKLCCCQAGYHQPQFEIYFNVISDCCHLYLFAHNETSNDFPQASHSRVSPTKRST